MPSPINIENSGGLTGHRDAVYTLEKAGSPLHFFSAGGDGMIIEWDAISFAPGKVVARLPSAVYALQYLPQKGLLFAATRLNGLYVLDLKNQKEITRIGLPATIYDIRIINNTTLAAALADGYLYFISLQDFSIIKTHHPTGNHARKIAVMPGAIATGWSDNKIRIYGSNSLEETHSFAAHDNSVFSLSYVNSDENFPFLLSGGRDAKLNVWDVARNFELIKTIPAHWFTINGIAFNSDKNIFATASRDKTVKIWGARSFELLKVLDGNRGGHTHSVNTILWLSENYLISAGDDKTIKVWKMEE